METKKYHEIRKELVTGDIILWRGKSLISRIIELFTLYSHASLVVRMDMAQLKDRLFVIESLPEGLSIRLLSKKINNYHGKSYLFQPTFVHLEGKEMQDKILEWAFNKLARGISYDFKGLIANIFGRVHPDAKQYFCSEFVADALIENGIKSYGPKDKAARPGDIPKWFLGKTTQILKDKV